jgi:ribosomal-protein-alanine N-acetyltransferase
VTAETVAVVPMTTAHVDALMPYERQMFGSEAWTRAGYRAELRDARSRFYVAAEDGAGDLLGWAGVLIAGDQAEILTVGVVPHARRRGIATQLLNALRDRARSEGARELFLEVRVDNEAAQRLYEREGFAVLGRRRGYYDHGRVDAVVMRREL